MLSRKMILIAGFALVIVGAVWAFQGAGTLGGSFMTGEPRWLYIGMITAIAGLVILAVGARLRNR